MGAESLGGTAAIGSVSIVSFHLNIGRGESHSQGNKCQHDRRVSSQRFKTSSILSYAGHLALLPV